MYFNRCVHEGLLAALAEGGFAHSLVEYANSHRLAMDLALRTDVKAGKQPSRSWATLYVGLTAVMHLSHEPRQGRFKITAHPTYTGSKSFEPSWTRWTSGTDMAAQWPAVDAYLEDVVPQVLGRHVKAEGTLQAAVSSASTQEYAVLDREVVVRFPDQRTKQQILHEINAPVLEVIQRFAGAGFGALPKSFGAELDALAVDREGHLLAIEIKPAGTASIAWAPAQAVVYACMLERWLQLDPQAPTVIARMAADRRAIRLGTVPRVELAERPEVRPWVAVQRCASSTHLDRARLVRDALVESGVGSPVEIRLVDLAGRLHPLEDAVTE